MSWLVPFLLSPGVELRLAHWRGSAGSWCNGTVESQGNTGPSLNVHSSPLAHGAENGYGCMHRPWAFRSFSGLRDHMLLACFPASVFAPLSMERRESFTFPARSRRLHAFTSFDRPFPDVTRGISATLCHVFSAGRSEPWRVAWLQGAFALLTCIASARERDVAWQDRSS